MLIEMADPSTYPESLHGEFIRFVETMSERDVSTVEKNLEQLDSSNTLYIDGFEPGVEMSAPLYRRFSDILMAYSFVCYHATRVLDVNQIRMNGLLPNSWDSYSARMEKVLAELNVPDIPAVMRCLCSTYKYKSKISANKPEICFFSERKMAGIQGGSVCGKYCQNIGGETADWALRDQKPEVLELLKKHGIGVIVRFEIPFHDFAPSYIRDNVIYRFILYYAALYFKGIKYVTQFDGKTNTSIPPDRILDIIGE